MACQLSPVEDKLKIYSATSKYILDKGLIESVNFFETKYESVAGMKDVKWKVQLKKEMKSLAIYLCVDTSVPIKCEVSFEIASEPVQDIDVFQCNKPDPPKTELQHFHGIVTAESKTIGTENFINLSKLFAKKQKFFVHQKTSFHVRAIFSFTKTEDQALYGITKMIQPQSDLPQRFQNHGQKDFKFIAGNESVEIHKFFLSLESTVFASMLENQNFIETKNGEMKFTEFKFVTIKAFVAFCYGEDISKFMVSTENAIELLTFADMYDVENLKTSFAEYYRIKLSRLQVNVAKLYLAARELNASKLRGICFEFIHSLPNEERKRFVKFQLPKEIQHLF